MKVLQVNCVYDRGSTGHLVTELHRRIVSYGVQSIVCYGRGPKIKERNLYKVSNEVYSKCQNALSRVSGYMYGGCVLSTAYIKRIIIRENPDIVNIHCINGYFVNIYALIEWLKCREIKTVVTLHAEFMYTGNCSHALDCEKWKIGCGDCPRLKMETHSVLFDHTHDSWMKMFSAFNNFNECKIVSVSPWVQSRSMMSPILNKYDNRVIYNGINTETFTIYNSESIKTQYDLYGKKVILHVTPYFSDSEFSIKGGKYIIQVAQRMIDENIVVLVAGNYKPDMVLPHNIRLLGYINNQVDLAKLYSAADVTLLTSKKETFSMVTAESLCCGTPVAGFLSGGPEQITIDKYSRFVEFGDINQLYQGIKELFELGFDKHQVSHEAAKKYSTETMVEEYYRLYTEMLNN